MTAPELLKIRYTNWRGETADRTIKPIRLWWGNTEWHPNNQWMLEAYDVEKGAQRDFALVDIVFRPALASSPEVAALIAEARREGWNAAIEAAAKHVVELTHSIRLGCFLSADKETDLVLHPIGQCAAAIRALKEETP